MKLYTLQNLKGLLVLIAVFSAIRAQTNSLTDYGATPSVSRPAGDQSAAGQKLNYHTDLCTGRFNYAIPVEVPPARQGSEPGIALQYGSSDGNGWCGVGWDLDLGYIQRETRHGVPVSGGSYSDTYGNSAGFNTFTFSVAGHSGRLVKASDGSYRPEINKDFLKFNYSGGYWTAFDKDGRQYTFGDTSASPNSKISGSLGTFKWALNKIVDPNGNVTTVTYQAPGDGQIYLNQISYNASSDSPAIAANCSVSFGLDSSRTDVPVSYLSGAKIATTRRLQSISVANNGALVRRYALQYVTSASTGRSLLNSVTEYGTDNSSTLPPHIFAYSVQNLSFQPPVNWTIDTQGNDSDPWWNSVGNNDIDLVDINGDGLPDRVMRKYNQSYTGFDVQLNNGHGFNSTVEWGPIVNEQNDTTAPWNSPAYNINEDLVDINGDLLPDRVTASEGTPGQFYVRTNSGVAGSSTGFGSLQSWSVNSETTSYTTSQMQGVSTTDSLYGHESIVLLSDMNGDGLADRVMLGGNSSQIAVQLNQRGSFGSITHWTGVAAATGLNAGPTSFAPRAKDGYWTGGGFYADLVDINGDGLPDRVTIDGVQFNNGYGGFTSLQSWSGLGSSTYPTIMNVTDGAHYTMLIDINGDGLPDRVTDNKDGTWSVQLNTGSGFGSTVTWTGVSAGGYSPTTGWYAPCAWDGNGTRIEMIDMNGDGLPDRVIRGTDGNLQVQLNSGPFPDLLIGVTNGIGGCLSVSYTNGASFNNSDGTRPRLPIPAHVVTAVTESDGLNTSGTTTYNYHNGFYDTTWREFRGFAEVDEIDPLGAKTSTYFYQGGGTNNAAHGEYQDTRFKAGMPFDVLTYGSDGNLYKETLSQITQVRVDSAGIYFPFATNVFEIDYEATGHPRATLTQYAYAVTAGNLAASTGNLLQESYLGEVANVTYSFGYSTVADPAAPLYTAYTYAALSNVNILDKVSSVTVSSASAVLRQTTNAYDGATGNLTQEGQLICPGTYAMTYYTHDGYGNVAATTDPVGIVTTKNYDSTATFPWRKYTGTLGNNLIDYTLYDPRSGSILAETNEQGLVTANAFDVFLRLTTTATSITPNGAATLVRKQIQYNLGGIASHASQNYVRTLENDPANTTTGYHETDVYFDGLGRPIQSRSLAETGQYRVGDFVYDARGSLMLEEYPLFQPGSSYAIPTGTRTTVWTQFDPIGRPWKINPCASASFNGSGGLSGTPTPLTGDSGSPVGPTSMDYNDGNNPWAIVVTNALGKIHKYELDSQGRTNQIIEVTSGGNFVTQLGYDLAGDLTTITDNAFNQTSFYYDGVGRRVAMTHPDMGFWQWTYDAAGNLKVQTDAKGQQLKYYYNDPAGRLTERDGFNAAGQQVSANTWSYDSNAGDSSCAVYPGQLYKVTDDEGWEKYSYDVRDRTLQTVRYLSKNGNTYTSQSSFDDADRPTLAVYPNGGPAITNLYDPGEHLSQVGQAGGTVFYSAGGFNALNQLTGIGFGNGAGTTLSYYPVSRRLQSIVTAKSANLQSLTYSYDAVGNVAGVADGVYSGQASATLGNITYDDLNRLTAVTNAGGSFSYAFDSVGNVLTNKEAGSGAYSYGAGGIRPDCVRSANGMWFTYDLNGNVVFRGGQRLDYNVNNQLYRVWNTNGVLTFFGYAFDGTRLWEQSGTNALQVWIGNNYEEKQGQILYHIYADGRQVCTFDKTEINVFQYYHPDDLTSTSIQTDTNGNVIQNYEYSAFGQSRYTQSTNVFRVSRRYTGQVLDDATGLYYYNFRYYDPILIRFIQGDDRIPDFANPQSYNRYAYCLNDPLRYTDPSGHAENTTVWQDLGTIVGSWFAADPSQAISKANNTYISQRTSLLGPSENILPAMAKKSVEMAGNTAQNVAEQYTGGKVLAAGGVIVGGVIVKAAKAGENGYQAFKSFEALKRALGPAGEGNVWHHIVEQRAANVEKFGAEAIHNTENVVNVSREVNQKIANFYSSKQPFSGNQTVREWLTTQSYQQQRDFGLKILKQFNTGK